MIGDVCGLAAGGDSVWACALLVETVGGAITCGAVLLIISFCGCKDLQSVICGLPFSRAGLGGRPKRDAEVSTNDATIRGARAVSEAYGVCLDGRRIGCGYFALARVHGRSLTVVGRACLGVRCRCRPLVDRCKSPERSSEVGPDGCGDSAGVSALSPHLIPSAIGHFPRGRPRRPGWASGGESLNRSTVFGGSALEARGLQLV